MEIISIVLSAISIVISAFVSLYIFIKQTRHNTYGYISKMNIIKDITILNNNLASICLKVGSKNLTTNEVDISDELDYVNEFIRSTTMSYLISMDMEVGFISELVILSYETNESYKRAATFAKKIIDELHEFLGKTEFFKDIKNKKIIDIIYDMTNTKNHKNQYYNTIFKNIVQEGNDREKAIYERFVFLKNKGINDPFIDCAIAIANKDEKECLRLLPIVYEKYGPNITDMEILEKYSNELKDFKA